MFVFASEAINSRGYIPWVPEPLQFHFSFGYITCSGYGYVLPILVGFWAQTSLKKGPFFGRFSLKMDGLSRNWRKLVKNGCFATKMHYKSGYDGNFQ